MGPPGERHRVAFVVQRYGEHINGGSEVHCRRIAERLVKYYEVEIITTTAVDHLSWKNALPAGTERLNGVLIRRFPVEAERNAADFQAMHDRILQVPLSPDEEHQMLCAQGPYSPKVVEYIRKYQSDYSAFVLFTYLYYPTCLTLPIVQSRAIFVPTAHDEPMLYLGLMDELFHQTPHLFYNSEEERHLVARRFNLDEEVGRTVGVGIEKTGSVASDPLWQTLREQIGERHLVTYIGRVEHDKGCGELVEFFLKYIWQAQRSDLVLLLIGRRAMDIPSHCQILAPGYVSEFVKAQALEASAVVAAPSPYESLCMAALEALLYERPLLVNGRCDVLVGHCVRSNGGLWYRDYEQFAEALTLLLEHADLRRALGTQGGDYVRRNYRWEVVESAYRQVIEQIASAPRHGRMVPG